MLNTFLPRTALLLSHRKALRRQLAKLSSKIALEQSRLDPNYQQLHFLKVRRMMVIDQMQWLDAIQQKRKEALQNGSARKAALT